jgi:hypothetical protein
MELNKEILDKYVAEGWLSRQVHPTLPLSIYNYTQETQYEKYWDSITLACRGVVVDHETGEVLVRPFPKFFNWEEVADRVPVTGDYVYVQEKMDGSLGILFYYEKRLTLEERYNIWFNNNVVSGMERNFDPTKLPDFNDPYYEPTPVTRGEWVMATRGSFTSEQAVKGLAIARRLFNLDAFKKSVTYLCEIIYPENRIVVDYSEEKLVFLGASIPRAELNWTVATTIFIESEIKPEYIVKTEQYFLFGEGMYNALKEKNLENKEGYVLRFYPSNFRMKIKFEDYIKLHRVLTQCSSYDIWENLKQFDKLPNELLDNIPDEFYKWVEGLEISIRLNFNKIRVEHEAMVAKAREEFTEKRDFALWVNSLNRAGINHSLLFAIWDGKDAAPYIWPMVKPRYEKPFQK